MTLGSNESENREVSKIFFCFFFSGLGLFWSIESQGRVYLYLGEGYVGEDLEDAVAPQINRMTEAKVFVEGGPGTISSPFTFYIPLDTDDDSTAAAATGQSRERYTFFGNKLSYASLPDGGGGWVDRPALPSIDSVGATSSFPNRPFVKVVVTHDSLVNKYICGAFKGKTSSSYRMLSSPNVEIPPNATYYVKFYFEDMNFVDTTALKVTSDGLSFDETGYLYIFEAPPGSIPKCTGSIGEDINPDSYPGGLLLKLKFSSTIDVTASGQATMVSLRAGDGFLLAKYDATTVTTVNRDIRNTMVVSLMADRLGQAPADLRFSHTRDLIAFLLNNRTSQIVYYTPSQFSGELRTGRLDNGRSYQVGVMTLSKFGFTSNPMINLSVSSFPRTFMPGVPQSIDTFIQEQSCYLLSAGFGEEHFVIEYFKDFRDHVLNKFSLGRLFIKGYYASAPQFAPTIYHSKFLSFSVRMAGYFMYYLFRSSFFWVPLVMMILGIHLWRRAPWRKSV